MSRQQRAATWRPVIVTVPPGDTDRFVEACRDSGVEVLDTIDRQLSELAVVRLPAGTRAAAAELEQQRRRFVADLLSHSGGSASLGVWVYQPWSHRVVHLLAEEDFFEVITSRNQDKISRTEQQELRGRTVGVLGLSVGGEAAVTVAQEHLCGELRLADYDRLDLSNLNRLQAGVEDLGVPKARIVARRVAAINPFLRVTLFDQGVTRATAGDFLDGLDLLVEECDDLALKYDIRVLAKRRGVDVVYAADERGFLSVEPYRTHPDLPIFHGLVAAAHPARESYPSQTAFMRALTEWLGGWDAISARSRHSVNLIGTSLAGYPQLAGEARFAAGQVSHVARRLLLGEPVAPFHGHLDLAEVVQQQSG
jgi:molybdopterin/thiamine biosynthesis adenylyltransferase